jgi:hypothetical protein
MTLGPHGDLHFARVTLNHSEVVRRLPIVTVGKETRIGENNDNTVVNGLYVYVDVVVGCWAESGRWE